MTMLARVLGAGISFTSEAIQAARRRSSSSQDASYAADGCQEEEIVICSNGVSVNKDHARQTIYQNGKGQEDTVHE
jgi:hypothetical protein